MWSSFWEKIGEGFAEDWNLRVLTPAFIFWVGGAVQLVLSRSLQRFEQLANLETVSTILVIVVALFVLIFSQYAVQALVLPILHLLQGHWGRWLEWLRRFVTARVVTPTLEKKEERWQTLARGLMAGRLTSIEAEEYAKLDADLSNYPVEGFQERVQRMPTTLGNILRAGEQYSSIRYGLQLNVILPRLWLVLPENVQSEIADSRHTVERNAEFLIWSILFSVWCIWGWYAVIISIVLSFWMLHRIVAAAEIYALLIRSAFDDYRFAMYRSLNWPLPRSTQEELLKGEELTSYLSRGPFKEVVFQDQH